MCTIICENEIIPRQLALRIEVDADELALKCKINNWINHTQNDPQHMHNDICGIMIYVEQLKKIILIIMELRTNQSEN